MKKLISITLVTVFLCLNLIAIIPVSAQETAAEITVLYNGDKLEFDVPPYLDAERGRVMVPMRVIFETLGSEIDWDGEAMQVTATKGDTKIVVTLYEDTALINGKLTELDCPAIIKDDRTLVPLRFVSENLGAEVEWIGETMTVVITSEDDEEPEETDAPEVSAVPTTKPAPEPLVLTDAMKKDAIAANVYFECTEITSGNAYKLGSGVMISPDGLILTNYHVVCESDSVRLQTKQNGGWYYERDIIIMGYDKEADLALIKLKGVKNLPYAKIAEDYTLTAGEGVYMVGNPVVESRNTAYPTRPVYTYHRDVITEGIVYDTTWSIGKRNMIRCDIEIHPGNSGGAFYNSNGELVGIARLGDILVEDGEKALAGFVPMKYYDEIKDKNLNVTVAEFRKEAESVVTPQEFVDMLGKKYVGVKLADNKACVRVDNISAIVEDDGELFLYIYMDYENYKEYVNRMKGGSAAIMQRTDELLAEILEFTKEKFGDRDITISYGLGEYMDNVPKGFEDSAYYNINRGKWDVWHEFVVLEHYEDDLPEDDTIEWDSILPEEVKSLK